MSAPSFYETLGVSQQASAKDIREAFLQLARVYHPDLNQDNPQADAQFKQIREAYETLRNSRNRAEYDANPDGFSTGFSESVVTPSRPHARVHRSVGPKVRYEYDPYMKVAPPKRNTGVRRDLLSAAVAVLSLMMVGGLICGISIWPDPLARFRGVDSSNNPPVKVTPKKTLQTTSPSGIQRYSTGRQPALASGSGPRPDLDPDSVLVEQSDSASIKVSTEIPISISPAGSAEIHSITDEILLNPPPISSSQSDVNYLPPLDSRPPPNHDSRVWWRDSHTDAPIEALSGPTAVSSPSPDVATVPLPEGFHAIRVQLKPLPGAPQLLTSPKLNIPVKRNETNLWQGSINPHPASANFYQGPTGNTVEAPGIVNTIVGPMATNVGVYPASILGQPFNTLPGHSSSTTDPGFGLKPTQPTGLGSGGTLGGAAAVGRGQGISTLSVGSPVSLVPSYSPNIGSGPAIPRNWRNASPSW